MFCVYWRKCQASGLPIPPLPLGRGVVWEEARGALGENPPRLAQGVAQPPLPNNKLHFPTNQQNNKPIASIKTLPGRKVKGEICKNTIYIHYIVTVNNIKAGSTVKLKALLQHTNNNKTSNNRQTILTCKDHPP